MSCGTSQQGHRGCDPGHGQQSLDHDLPKLARGLLTSRSPLQPRFATDPDMTLDELEAGTEISSLLRHTDLSGHRHLMPPTKEGNTMATTTKKNGLPPKPATGDQIATQRYLSG